MIKNSLGVATITGSVGWETLKMNKPIITFGYPWYSFCGSNFHFDNSTVYEEILNFINVKTKHVVMQDVKNFLNLIQPYCFRSIPIQWKNFDEIDNKDELANNYVRNLVEYITCQKDL